MSSLFAYASESDASRPLPERLRPKSLDEVVGQKHLLDPGRPLRLMIESDRLKSMILWGPPGVGKTSIARLLASTTKADFVPFSAVMSGIKEIKAVMADAERRLIAGRKTVLFVDEIHRFNKSQQDAFLPYVERGDIVLVGATTENPSFEINSALLSRAKVFVLKELDFDDLLGLLQRGLRELGLEADEGVLEWIANFSGGDARQALNLLELAGGMQVGKRLLAEHVEAVLQRKVLPYDKAGEEHFNLISALHKSVRSSDADAALYWLARMLSSGEDRMYLARRLVRMAIEDIGLADPKAIEQAMACQQAVHLLCVPEGDLALAQLTIYLSVAPKSDASYQALKAAIGAAEQDVAQPVPLHLRNAPTRLMKEIGYGEGYKHAHAQADAISAMACLPENLLGKIFYRPTNRGFETRLRDRLTELSAKKSQLRQEHNSDLEPESS